MGFYKPLLAPHLDPRFLSALSQGTLLCCVSRRPLQSVPVLKGVASYAGYYKEDNLQKLYKGRKPDQFSILYLFCAAKEKITWLLRQACDQTLSRAATGYSWPVHDFITHNTRILFHKAHLYKSIRFIFTCTANQNCVQTVMIVDDS